MLNMVIMKSWEGCKCSQDTNYPSTCLEWLRKNHEKSQGSCLLKGYGAPSNLHIIISVWLMFIYDKVLQFWYSSKFQVIIVPCGITASMEDTDRIALIGSCEEFEAALKAAGIRVRGDYRVNYSPGWKFNHWELKVRNIYVFQYSMFSITQWNTFKMMIN